ncbi:MAG TPA: hypothetical protein VMM14_00040 [Acidimicrobiia bacterium]|nr:hypothetical protein [Acidimicrobiia bacterium]
MAIVADVTSEDDWGRVVAVADEVFGGVDILVANTGNARFSRQTDGTSTLPDCVPLRRRHTES